MSTRDMKKYSNYSEGPFKMENEPEEGEIVDEYDLIVSSDEELSMRQRIRELEAENEEIEQIAVISRSYNDKINPPHTHLENSRAAQVPTDASSISSTEFVTPKKRKRRKSKEHKRKHCHHQHQHQHHHHQYDYEHNRYDQYQDIPLKTRSKKTHCKRRQKLFAKKNQKLNSDRHTYKEINIESISLDSFESSDSSTGSLSDTDNYSKHWLSLRRKDEQFDYDKYMMRDTLRFAVARNSNEETFSSKRSCLKDKLLKQDLVGQLSRPTRNEALANEVQNQNIEVEDDDDDVQVIENEPEIQTIDEDSTDSMEEKELRLIALKSAVLKKHMQRKMRNAEAAYSPTDFDEMLSSGILKEDNKLDDIDVVDLEAEDSQNACVTVSPEASPQLMMLDDQEESQQMVDCKPVDMDIANSDSEDTTVGSWSKDVEPMIPTFPLASHDFTNHFQYGYYMPDLHELPPPPPGVDDYEDAPPPPPYHKVYNFEMQDMDLDNEEMADNLYTANSVNIERKESDLDNDSNLPTNASHQDDNEDEEEEALRALLLSKFQSPKNQKKVKRTIEVHESQDTLHGNEFVEQSENNVPTKPTEFILKEAVKRLKIHSKNELSKEESLDDLNKQDSSKLNAPAADSNSSETKESLEVIEKLKNRLKTIKTEKLKCNSKGNDNIERNMDEKTHELLEDSNMKISEENSELECPTNISCTQEFSSKIDISDITRRLQQIKENVLNSTNKVIPQEPVHKSTSEGYCERFNVPENLVPEEPVYKNVNDESCDKFSVSDNIENENRQPLEKIKELNNFDSCEDSSNACKIDQPPINEKTVEANFDDATKQTTFKVTITNSAATKPSLVTVLKNPKNDVSLKENKSNNGTKNAKLKVNTKNKVALNSERLVKIIRKTNETPPAVESKASANKTSPVVKPVTPQVPTYSLLRTTKIVKPNKVINTNFDLNRRQVVPMTETTTVSKTITKNETSTQLAIEKTDNSRLITSIDQVKHMCKIAPIVISVQNSSNESSGDEWGGDYDSMYKPVYDYNDNASPLSLNMESPSHTPIRSNSPTNSTTNESTKNVDINAKKDDFLKLSRTTVTSENAIKKTQKTNDSTNQSDNINKTPLAVRHLPPAAQSEYRRLVHRMKLLENKRKSTNIEDNNKDYNTIESKKNDSSLTVSEEPSKEKDTTNGTSKTSLVKTVLIRNANNTSATENENQKPAATSKFHKANVLRSYENLYVKFGAGIVNNLEKSLTLVEEAKKAKISKLKLEQRLKELKAEMDILQGKHKEEQQKISRIYPSICSTNEVITSLKQKRSKVFKAAINLGKTLKGEDYRLNNDLKESINSKSKQLAAEIKLVNSLKVQDIAKIEESIKSSLISKDKKDSKKETQVENIQTKSNKETVENKAKPNTLTATTLVQKKEVEITNENPLQPDEGGNTEFQNTEPNNYKNYEENESIIAAESDTKRSNLEEDKKQDDKSTIASYISPLEHLRNIDSNVDPNGVICPYDLMGNCEDATCKYVHISTKEKS